MENTKNSVNAEKVQLQQLISDISHQLKTPMTTLRLTESAMEKAITKPQELKTLFHTNTAHLNKLEFLISSLVKISRLETGVIKLSPSYQTIGDTILMALENIVLAADQKNIQITFNYSEDFKAYHDPKWTSEALYNILDNAVKYTNENGHISIELFTLENYTKIAITDSGIGIKESEIPKLFQRFYRSPSVKNFPGVGVGLHLAQDIISDNMVLSTCFLPFMWAVPLKFGLSTQTLLNKKNAATGFSITRNGIFLYYFIQPSLHYQILNMS